MLLSFHIGTKRHEILAVYRPPSQDERAFVQSLGDWLESRPNKGNTFLTIAGDINLHLPVVGDADSRSYNPIVWEYLTALESVGLQPYIIDYTREVNGASSCLDHIFSNYPVEVTTGKVTKIAITDHYFTSLCTRLLVKKNNRRWEKSSIDMDGLLADLENENWSTVLSKNCSEEAAESFTTKLTSLMIKHTTVKTIPTDKRKRKPWITQGLIRSIRKRDSLYRRIKKEPLNIELKDQYVSYRNQLRTLLFACKQSYYTKKLAECDGDVKSTWKAVHEITDTARNANIITEIKDDNGEMVKDPETIANKFNAFFTGIGPELAAKIPHESMKRKNCQSPKAIFKKFTRINVEDGSKLISSLRIDSAAGPDGIPTKIIKNACEWVVKPIVHIINLILTTGVFPKSYKLAEVVPIHKSSDKTEMTNYRPISKIGRKLLNSNF